MKKDYLVEIVVLPAVFSPIILKVATLCEVNEERLGIVRKR
jgi:hypothetical protein